MPHHYNLWLVALSLAVAVLASYTTLDIALRVRKVSRRYFRHWLAGGSIALGLGIWSMHFIGVLACMSPIPLGYDPVLTALSTVPAIGAAAVALGLVRRGVGARAVIVIGGSVIGAGIVAMHYTGMAALKMSPALHDDPWLYAASCAIAVSSAMAALWLGLRLGETDRRLTLKKLGGASVLGVAICGMHYTGMAAARLEPGSVSLALKGGLDGSTMAVAVGVGSIVVLTVLLFIGIIDGRLAIRHAVARELLEKEVNRRQARERQLEYLALHDQLTGLANRACFLEQLPLALQQAGRHGTLVAVLAIDLNRFKQVNDEFGHATGDALLDDVARRLRTAVKAGDVLARLGGDEFAVLAVGETSAGAFGALAQNLLDALGDAAIGSTGMPVDAGIGIALFPQDGSTADELLRCADFAVYHAKQSGRSGYRFFDGKLENRVRSQQRRLEELSRALENNELAVHYQPQVDVASETIVGVEALLRWNHPLEGPMDPDEFIPLAEEAGIMPAIDAWVIHRACSDAAIWREQGIAVTLSVNVSAQSVTPALVATATAALRNSGLPRGALEFELTETALLNAADTGVVGVLRQLDALGIQLSIDDFGTGYGSLLYLRLLPISAIKIDRRFVQAAPGTPQDAAIVQSLLDLGRTLNLRVIAEGVETARQLELLRDFGCCTVQGYWFSRAVLLSQLLQFPHLAKATAGHAPATLADA